MLENFRLKSNGQTISGLISKTTIFFLLYLSFVEAQIEYVVGKGKSMKHLCTMTIENEWEKNIIYIFGL